MHSLFGDKHKHTGDKDLDAIVDRLKNNDPKLTGIKSLFVHSADVNKFFKVLKDNKYCSSVAIHGPGVTNGCSKNFIL